MSITEAHRPCQTSPRDAYDLWLANDLVKRGMPLVLAFDRGNGAFTLEKRWQLAEPSGRTLDRWLNGEGDLLAAVCGHTYDVFDFDPQNGGYLHEFLAYFAQGHRSITVQGVVRTPSGGYHLYVNSLGQRKRSWPGVDYQGQRSFAFIPPSRKLSKATNKLAEYKWLDYAFGGKDSGAAILSALEKWPNPNGKRRSRVQPARAGSSFRLSINDVRSYMSHGIPDDLNHDDTLKDIVWLLCLWHVSKPRALIIWSQIVANTPEKGGKRPYDSDRDFERHWNGAASKLSANESGRK